MSTEWSHLPNAAHIDRVLASLKSHPKEWVAARLAARDMAYDMARDMARSAARDMARSAAMEAARDMARSAAWDESWLAARSAARSAILALIAYDDCAHLLDMPSDQLRVWVILSEKPAAVLLLPAVIAFEKINLLENQI